MEIKSAYDLMQINFKGNENEFLVGIVHEVGRLQGALDDLREKDYFGAELKLSAVIENFSHILIGYLKGVK